MLSALAPTTFPSAEKPPKLPKKNRVRGVIEEPTAVTLRRLAEWKQLGVNAVAVVLDEAHDHETYQAAAKAAAAARIELYYWVEVARNPAMADEHPRWMAALGVHEDWRARFPNAPEPNRGGVVKAYPWVPITHREAYDAHLHRIRDLLRQRAASPYAGVLLNDLQGGPSSCGCGNPQCRWATDYHVPSTATKLDGDDVAAQFTSEVRAIVGDKAVVPVWATECEDIDLPAKLAPGGKSTGLSGTVECANATCPKAFAKQWAALLKDYNGPVGVLALHKELGREPAWVPRTVAYLDRMPMTGGKAVPHERLWLVVEGSLPSSPSELASHPAADEVGTGATFHALVPLKQSFEPRLIAAK